MAQVLGSLVYICCKNLTSVQGYIYFSIRVNFFPTYFTTSLNFFPISCTRFYCSLLNFFPNLNFGWIFSLPKKQGICKNIYPCLLCHNLGFSGPQTLKQLFICKFDWRIGARAVPNLGAGGTGPPPHNKTFSTGKFLPTNQEKWGKENRKKLKMQKKMRKIEKGRRNMKNISWKSTLRARLIAFFFILATKMEISIVKNDFAPPLSCYAPKQELQKIKQTHTTLIVYVNIFAGIPHLWQHCL